MRLIYKNFLFSQLKHLKYSFGHLIYISKYTMFQKKDFKLSLNEIMSNITVEIHLIATSMNNNEKNEIIIMDCLDRILNLLVLMKDSIEILDKHAKDFDSCTEIEYNGFRSLLYITEKYFVLILKNITKFKEKKSSFFFSIYTYEKTFQNMRDLLSCIYFMLKIAEKIMTLQIYHEKNSNRKSLFVSTDDPINKILYEPDVFIDKLFFGDFLGFYVN